MKFLQKIFNTLSSREKMAVNVLIFVIVVSLVASILGFYYYFTKPIPVPGGEYSEGIVGQPMYINPILAFSNQADEDLSSLIFSSLFKYDSNGKIIPDLSESIEASDNGLVYTVKLKKDIKWHDGEPFTVDDVVFTFQLIQDPSVKSPLRQRWQGVGIEVIDDSTIKFSLPVPYAAFLENNLTTGILPRHIWETVTPGGFSLAEYNIRPIGTGPFKFANFEKDSGGMILSYELERNEDYYGQKPYLERVRFEFYPDEEAMIEAFNNKQIFGMQSVAPENLKEIKSRKSADIKSISIPRYFAVFFNQQKSKVLADREVRNALSLATDRKIIIKEVLFGYGQEVHSPILSGMEGYSEDVKKFDFDLAKAEKILDDDGWKKEGGIRKKDGLNLELSIVTTDWPPLQQTVDILKNQWEKIGAKVNVEFFSVGEIQQNYIRTREYDAILFGQSWTSFIADPFSLWHSSQSRDPGLNLALYANVEADKVIEKLQEETREENRLGYIEKFQEIVADDIPAVFLYSPNHVYVMNKKIQGNQVSMIVNAQGRFSDVVNWYMKTKRVKK